ncbi:IS3 family transposase [Treponema phagedenis]|uniref:IS3 family transposase n=1 Tax=Treponema phagedenis TaxID=162 RepID=UPI00197E9BB0|nr:IS3 family transposase [Treponema phagedenis]
MLLTPLRTEPKNIVLKESCYIAIKEQRYTSHAYREKLTELGMIQSMSRRGNCWDNACIENFFGTIKCESGYYGTLENGLLTYKQMEELIGKYIEFFNNERIQKKLGWKSPVDFRTFLRARLCFYRIQ